VHILHVIGSLSPADGGPPEAVRQFATIYRRIGDSMEVLCQDPPHASWLTDYPCPVHALGQRWLGRFGLSPAFWRWLHRNASRFDGIVMHGIWIFPNLAVRAAARKAGVDYGVFVHGALDPWFNKRYPLKHLKKLLYWPLQYPVLRDARAAIFTTPSERDLAATSFSPSQWNSVIIPYAIGEPEGDPAAQIAAFYQKIPALRDRRYLLFLSRIQQKKGCDLLIQAFARIAPLQPDLDLVMAGPDQVGWQQTLRTMAQELGIADRVHWPGMLSGDVKWGAFRAAEAFILPSHQENFGIAVVESLAVGRPVLISNQINIWEDVEREGVGLVETDTLEGTEQLIRRWLALPAEQRNAMAARCEGVFSSRFSSKGSAELLNRMLMPADVRPPTAAAL
jgi:glycosyltransferase involved in cell wall biosynthesis